MFDTMTLTKVTAGLCGALLVFLLGNYLGSAIYHAGSHHGEQSYVIETGDEDAGEEVVEVAFADVYATADAAKGEKLFRQCSACHKLEDGANGTGPHLHALLERTIGAVGEYAYSGALEGHGDNWTAENLNGFIENPKGWAPGTKMSYKGMKKVEDRANLIAYLASVSN